MLKLYFYECQGTLNFSGLLNASNFMLPCIKQHSHIRALRFHSCIMLLSHNSNTSCVFHLKIYIYISFKTHVLSQWIYLKFHFIVVCYTIHMDSEYTQVEIIKITNIDSIPFIWIQCFTSRCKLQMHNPLSPGKNVLTKFSLKNLICHKKHCTKFI